MYTRSRRDQPRERDWAREESWWRQHYRTRPYVETERSFTFYQPGYRYGYESASRYVGRHWDEVEPELRRRWEGCGYRGDLAWDDAKHSVRDAWHHVTEEQQG